MDPMFEIGAQAAYPQTSHLVSSVVTTVSREKLLEALKANRAKHAEDHADMLLGWRGKTRQHFEQQLAAINSDKWKSFQGRGVLARPPCFLNDYDIAIKMFEMNVEDEVELEGPQFQAFVLDDWGWKNLWASNMTAYSTKVGASL